MNAGGPLVLWAHAVRICRRPRVVGGEPPWHSRFRRSCCWLIIVFLLVKKSGLKAGHAVVCVLLGFYLASSSIAPTINELTTNVAGMIGDIKF